MNVQSVNILVSLAHFSHRVPHDPSSVGFNLNFDKDYLFNVLQELDLVNLLLNR